MYVSATARGKPRVVFLSIAGLMLKAVPQEVESELASDVGLGFVACQCFRAMRSRKLSAPINLSGNSG